MLSQNDLRVDWGLRTHMWKPKTLTHHGVQQQVCSASIGISDHSHDAGLFAEFSLIYSRSGVLRVIRSDKVMAVDDHPKCAALFVPLAPAMGLLGLT